MKKLIIILCFLPLFSYSGNIYKALADTVFIGSIPYKTATGELIIFNSTKDTAGVLYNNGSGVTQFKKVRSIKLNDSTYVIKIGTSVIGDTIKILSSASSGGTVTDFTFTDGNGFDGTVTNSTTTPTLVLVADTLTKFASVMRLLDSITAINARVASKGSGTVTNVGSGYGTNFSAITSTGSIIVDSTVIGTKTYINTKFAQTAVGTVTSVATDNTLTGGTITSTGTLKVDTSRISTKGNVTGLLLNKQDNLISGTTIKTINSTSLLGSGNITTPDAQTLSTSYGSDSITLSISGGNSIKFAYAVDSVGMVSTDSLITYKAGVRRSYKVGSTGGGGALSAITAATATNTIDNTNYKQRWSWNTLAGDTALALNSSSTAAASNLNTLLAVTQSGTSSSVTQSTFGIKVSNTKVSTLGMNYALYAESSGSGGALPYGQYNPAVYAKGVEAPIIMDNYSSTGGNYIDYRLGGTEQGYIGFNYSGSSNYFYLMNKLPKPIIIGTNNTNWLYVGNNSGASQLGIGGVPTCPFEVSGTAVSSRIMKVHSGFIENDYAGDIAYVHQRGGNFGTIGVNSSGNFIIGINSAGTGTQIAIHATRDNVGMGTVTPVASAKLELSSTTQGLLISRGTTTNRDAISSPATLLQFGNTTSNTIDTYDGTRWTNGAKFLTNTATLDFGNTSAQTSADLTITVTGAADGDAVIIGVPNGSVNANSSYSAWVSSANTVTIRFNNYSSGSIDPASGIFKATVNK